MTIVTCSCCMTAFEPNRKNPHALEVEFKEHGIHFCPSCRPIADARQADWRQVLSNLYMHGILPKVS